MLNELTSKELQAILEYNSLNDLSIALERDKHRNAGIIARARETPPIRNIHNSTHAINAAIAASAVPIETWWLLTGVMGFEFLGVAALPLTLVILGISIVASAFVFHDVRQKRQKKNENAAQLNQLENIKLMVIDELIAREEAAIKHFGFDISQIRSAERNISFRPSRNNNIDAADAVPSKKKSVLVGSSVTALLMCSHLLGVSSLFFDMLGYMTLASALAGPIGIGIAIATSAIAIAIGIYVGYKHYQSQKIKYAMKLETEQLTNQLTIKQSDYNDLASKRKNLEMMSHMLSTVKSPAVTLLNNKEEQNISILCKHSFLNQSKVKLTIASNQDQSVSRLIAKSF